jgi:hypothetical protein
VGASRGAMTGTLGRTRTRTLVGWLVLLSSFEGFPERRGMMSGGVTRSDDGYFGEDEDVGGEWVGA